MDVFVEARGERKSEKIGEREEQAREEMVWRTEKGRVAG
jgi:hypothetical protein